MAEMGELEVIDEEVEDSKSASDSSDVEDDSGSKDTVPANCPSHTEFLQLKKELFEEFDSLGIGQAKENHSEVDLVTNAFNLVNIYRKMLVRVKDGNICNAKLKADNLHLEKQINAFKKTIEEKTDIIEDLNKKLTLTRMTCGDLEKEKSELQQKLQSARKSVGTKNNQWEHKIKQLEAEIERLREVNEKSIGNYISRDAITASVIQKYKANEAYYKETIKTLHENNQGLITHLLDLLQQDQEKSLVEH